MRYRNTISGEVIEVDAPISGEYWEDADEAEAREDAEGAETEDAEGAETEDANKNGRKKKA